jgi:hypothetical protein
LLGQGPALDAIFELSGQNLTTFFHLEFFFVLVGWVFEELGSKN